MSKKMEQLETSNPGGFFKVTINKALQKLRLEPGQEILVKDTPCETQFYKTLSGALILKTDCKKV